MPVDKLYSLPKRSSIAKAVGSEAGNMLRQEAEDVLAGRFRLFGGPPAPFDFSDTAAQRHWTDIHDSEGADIKFAWEPGRLGWACTLARAYYLSLDERYAQDYWDKLESFLEATPPYLGLHWVSAQEAAIRIIILAYTWQIFQSSSQTTHHRKIRLARAVADHARRIPPTLAYARAQNNNHLLVEAIGLWTAAQILPSHPQAKRWQKKGWRWLNWAMQNQIEPNGNYIQHSTNYHRLMLQAGLWCYRLARAQGLSFPAQTQQRLTSASRWLMDLTDPITGGVPNLGPNDGAYLMPLTTLPFSDYRPIIQAARQAFAGERPFEAGPWDEMRLWLAPEDEDLDLVNASSQIKGDPPPELGTGHGPHILRSKNSQSWAYLRVARFQHRPGHADQLHVDLWWQGINLAQDAGTFLYNASPPWNNSLTHTGVHNTVMINGQEQMHRAGRFLYLDWAQAEIVPTAAGSSPTQCSLTAQHDGYRKMGIIHRRSVEEKSGKWRIVDMALPVAWNSRLLDAEVRLHWLLPDVPWQLEPEATRISLHLFFPQGTIHLWITSQAQSSLPSENPAPRFSVFRAGERLVGLEPPQPTWGWASPTYGTKVPALALVYRVSGHLPITLLSEWVLPAE
jgi:hypothetical protein